MGNDTQHFLGSQQGFTGHLGTSSPPEDEATASSDGSPNWAGPRGTLGVLDTTLTPRKDPHNIALVLLMLLIPKVPQLQPPQDGPSASQYFQCSQSLGSSMLPPGGGDREQRPGRGVRAPPVTGN